MTTTQTSDLASFVERYAGVRAIAGDITKTLEEANTKLDETWHDLLHVADAYFTLLV